MSTEQPKTVISLGRYTLHGEIASGGMATVYMAHASGDAGFSRVVAIKRMLPKLASDPQFVAMFLDEASLASRVHHPNVVPILDVVADGGGFFIVMDYVRGQPLHALVRETLERGTPVPVEIIVGVMIGVLAGLHAAHEARDKDGHLLDIVHRDVSPQNILVGMDGTARIMDFGIAKASRQLHVTQAGQIKGKLSYMAPEQLRGDRIDRGADIFAAAIVLWGALAGRRLFHGADMTQTVEQALTAAIPKLAEMRTDVPPAIDVALAGALERDRAARYATARDFAKALERACPRVAGPNEIGEWVEALAGDVIAERDRRASQAEVATDPSRPAPCAPSDETTVKVVPARAPSEPTSPPPVAQDPASEVQTIELRPPYEENATTTGPSFVSGPSTPPPMTALSGPIDDRTTEVDSKLPAPTEPRRQSKAPALAVAALMTIITAAVGLRIFGAHRSEPRSARGPASSAAPDAPSESKPPLAPSIEATADPIAPEKPAPEASLALDGGVAASTSVSPPPFRPVPRTSSKMLPAAAKTAVPVVTVAPVHKGPPVDTPLLPERP